MLATGFLAATLLAFTAVPAGAATINVDAAASDSANSSTDADALCSPREAVISANQNSLTSPVNVSDCATSGTAGSDTVNIPAGTFTLTIAGENHAANDGALGGDLDLTDLTAIQGAGPSSTTLQQTVSDQRVIEVVSGGTGTVLSQIGITGGHLDVPPNDNVYGGGVFLNGGTPDINDVRVFANRIDTQGSAHGAGIASLAGGPPGVVSMTDVSAINNDSTTTFNPPQGGGIFAGGGTTALTRVRLIDNDLVGPSTAAGGGAFLDDATVQGAVVDNNTVTVTGSNKEYSQGAYGAGLYMELGTSAVSDATITNNDAIGGTGSSDAAGGGVFAEGFGVPETGNYTNLTIADNTVTASDDAAGGGFAAHLPALGLPADLSFVTLSGNSASGPAGAGTSIVDQVASLGSGSLIRFRASAIEDDADADPACGTGSTGGTDLSGGTFSSLGANAGVGTSCGLTGTNDVQSLASGGLGLGALADNTGGAAAYQAGATGFKAPIMTRAPNSGSTLLLRAAACTDADGATVTTDARGAIRPGFNCDAGAHEITPPPAAVNDAVTVAQGAAPITINVRANDTNATAETVGSVTQPANGTVVITNSGADLTYQPHAGYCNNPPGTSPDTFTYTLSPNGSMATVSARVDCPDTDPPETTITDGPAEGSTTKEFTPTFKFSADEANSTFDCSTDGAAFAPCSSPDTLTGVTNGQHSFAVRGTDPAKNVDPTPATRTFTISSVELRCKGKDAKIVGTPANDGALKGTGAADVIVGLNGNDKISGGAGNDLICSGKGVDQASGGAGNDDIRGRQGNDKISGGAGNDRLDGGTGNDQLLGGGGNDLLLGKNGNDHIDGGPGRNTCQGGAGANTLSSCAG